MHDAQHTNDTPDGKSADSVGDSPVIAHDQGVLGKSKESSPDDQQAPTKEFMRETRVIEWLQLGTNVLLAVIGIIALYVYRGQLDVMKGQLGEIVKQYPELHSQAVAATTAVQQAATDSAQNSQRIERQLKIAGDQARAAQDSVIAVRRGIEETSKESKVALDAAIDNFHQDQRAWVGLQMQDFQAEIAQVEGGRLRINRLILPFINTGKTPALSISGHCMLRTGEWNQPVPSYDAEMGKLGRTPESSKGFSYYQGNPGSGLSMDQSFIQGFVLSPSSGTGFNMFAGSTFGALKDSDGNTLTLYVLGTIDYSDALTNARHKTRFCLQSTAGSPFSFCATGNSMD